MSERIQRHRSASTQRDEATTPLVSRQDQTGDLDALLDEIDLVLESDAEEYVKGFVQKGGQ
ncbi:MAG: ubiquitin-like protein Pup [Propionibacteriaceae bacterium]|nr:ubiquitin-like protein Pup [Propionibacteriaceae bacterium]